jgi:hypothetical protein
MSVNYFVCAQCGDVGDDHSDGWNVCSCGNNYCSSECAEEAKLVEQENGDETGIYSVCGYCRGELFTDSELLKVALKKLELSRNDLVILAKNKLGYS